MSNCDVITLSSDDENNPCQHKSPLKRVTEIRCEPQDKPESRQPAKSDALCANKPHKRIHPICVEEKLKVEKEDQIISFSENHLILSNKKEEQENQSVFEKFLELCWQNSKSPEMKKILHRVQNCYMKTKPAYTSSQEFEDLVTCKMNDIIKWPCYLYVYIKDVVDEMKVRRLKQHEPPNKRQKTSNGSFANPDHSHVAEPGPSRHVVQKDENKDGISALVNSAESRYIDRKIKKLSKALKQLQNRIVKLEEKEVDFDDDNDSAFIKLERYKSRFCKVYQKLCELTGDSLGYKTTCRRRIAFSGTKSLEINRCIEKFVNKTGEFPDFHDILSLVKSVQSDAHMKPEILRSIAEEAFLSVGRQLQKQRQRESWASLSVFLKDQADPAESNPDLESELQRNYKEYAPRIQHVIDSFAEKQVAEKLVAEEVPDEDANKSEESGPDEGEDEEEEGEEEKDFVEKVLRGEDNLSSDEDMDICDHEENGKGGVLVDEDGYRSGCVFPDHEADIPEQMSNDIHLKDPLAVHSRSCSPSPSIVDVHQTVHLGPVSPPVLGEDLSKHGACCLKLSSEKEDHKSEVKSVECSSMSDTKCKLSPFQSDQCNLLVSKSSSPPLSIIPPSEQYIKSVPESLALSHSIHDDGVSDHSRQQDMPSPGPSLCTAILQDNAYERSKSEFSSASIIKSSADSSSPYTEQCDKPKTPASSPTFTIDEDAEVSDEDRASPSLLRHLNASKLDCIAEDSDSSGTVVSQPANVTGVESKGKNNSNLNVHTTLTRNNFISDKFIVTQMEMKSDANSRVSNTNAGDSEVKPRMRKFIRKVTISSLDKQKHTSMKSLTPDVITLE